ncbi:hypothetical protein NDA17_003377 [Ustilago hordei]|nr:hypothetical protein NDA17_003377 [Ustilago hordei]
MPESIHDIQRFLGFANFYRRFIAHFAHIAKPLTSLVKPIERFKKFELPEEAQQAFHKLIQAFTSAGVLQHFNYHLPTRLETDARAPSCVSTRRQSGPYALMESIAKGLKDLVKIFQPLDQELQEIHRKKPFELKDDLWYSGGRLVIPKVTMPGRTNNRHSRSAKEVDGQSLSVEHLRFMVMTQCHDGITAGHVGRDATIKAAQRHYWWPNMTAWIADYVASCPVCARYKAPRHRPYGLLQPLATPDRPWGSISLDFIEGLPPLKKYDSKTYDSILVIVNRLTKFAILAPTHKTVMAKQTAVLLYGHMVRLFRYPDHMVSDRGRQFISGAWKAFAEQMGVKHSLSMAYHPQTDGQTERVNQVIEQYLRMYCNYEQNDWANLLDTAAFVYNNTVHNSIGVSPFFACYGWNPKAHPDIPQ